MEIDAEFAAVFLGTSWKWFYIVALELDGISGIGIACMWEWMSITKMICEGLCISIALLSGIAVFYLVWPSNKISLECRERTTCSIMGINPRRKRKVRTMIAI